MAFCVSCGNQMRGGAAFCGKCGAGAATPVRVIGSAQTTTTFFKVIFTPLRMLLKICKGVLTAKSRWIRFGVPAGVVLLAVAAAFAPPDKESAEPREAGSAPVAASVPADAPPPDLAALPDKTVTAQQKSFALQALCGAIVGAGSAATPGQEKETTRQIAILSADQVIAKEYNLTMQQSNAVLQLAFNEQIDRGGRDRDSVDVACNPR